MIDIIHNIKLIEPKIRKAEALLFDLDGTLIDTDYANFLSYKKAIEQVKNTTSNLVIEQKKRVTRNNIREFFPNLSKEEYEEIIEIKENLYRSNLHATKLNTTVVSILDDYSDKENILVTNSRKERANLLLIHFDLIDKFTKKYYRENMTSNNKFKHVLSRLCIDANLVFVFENSESEIDAAITAGIPSENILRIM